MTIDRARFDAVVREYRNRISAEKSLGIVDMDILKKIFVEFDLDQKKMDEIARPRITCKADCPACCHISVTVTQPEAEIIAREIRSGDVQVDWGALRLQASCMGTVEWYLKQYPCLFLNKTGSCSIYACRPIACRNYRVIGDVKLCETIDEDPGRLIYPSSEGIFTAICMEYPHGPMAKMLLNELTKA